MSNSVRQSRRRADPSTGTGPGLLNTTLNPSVSKTGKALSPAPPSASGRSSHYSRLKTPTASTASNTVNAFWGEEEPSPSTSRSRNSASANGIKPDWMVEQERVSVKEWYSKKSVDAADSGSMYGSEASLASGVRRTVLFESQQIMPAPGTTYFQLVVESDRVLLRDWPRQRYSQKWTRNGGLNPGQKIFTLDAFASGEREEELVYIFGQDVYDKAVAAAKNAAL